EGFTTKKTVLAGTLALVILAEVFPAGCTSSTPSSTTPSAAMATATTAATALNVTQYLKLMMQRRNFTVVQPFSPQPSTQAGIAYITAR
ncbi:MAG: hypothetical protein ACXV4C_11080, partial [Halobacteriota archaeon]